MWRSVWESASRYLPLEGVVTSACTYLKVWPVSNFAQQHATKSNNMQQGAQTDATCNIQQCWELLANNVAFVCMGLKSRVPGPLPLPHVFAAGGRVLLHLGKSSIDGLVFCFVIIPCQLVFVWLFLVSVLTYRAASGALAVLSSSEKVCNQIIKVLLSNILYPSSKGLSTAKRAREFSTPLYYYARMTQGHAQPWGQRLWWREWLLCGIRRRAK